MSIRALLIITLASVVDSAAVVGGTAGRPLTNSTMSVSTSSAGSGAIATDGDGQNWRLSRSMVWSWIALVGGLMFYVCLLWMTRYMRTIACVPTASQKYFTIPNHWHAMFLKHFYQAPLFSKRHHREYQLSKAINVGTLPSRSQTFFLVGYLVMAITLTVYGLDWNGPMSQVLSEVVSRTGYMAIMNMLPLWLLAARNNPLITWTGISFDTYNLVHRWLGRIVVMEALTHAVAWIIKKVKYQGGWSAVGNSFASSRFILSGLIGVCAFTVIILHSPSAIRHAFYECFLGIHIVLAAMSLGAVYVHLEATKYAKERMIIQGVLAIWCTERGTRLIRLLYRNIGRRSGDCEVQALPGDCMRVKVTIPRPWRFRPGQHAYLYLPAISGVTSHPFTIAWSDETQQMKLTDLEKLPDTDQDTSRRRDHNLYFLVRRRTGMTETLWNRTLKSPEGLLRTKILLEGPYSQQSMESYGTVLLFAAGVGITHQIPHVRDLVQGYANGTVATRKVVLIWIIQSAEHLEWIRDWMLEILSYPQRREVLKILIYVTRPTSKVKIQSPSSGVQLFPQRPNIQAIVDDEVQHSVGAIGVSVCGIGAVADEVRKASRSWMDRVNIDFQEESFSW